MTCRFPHLAIGFAGLVLLSMPALAAPVAPCSADFTLCAIPEDILLQLPFIAIAGDAIVVEPGSTEVSDVFRIFNNRINTGGRALAIWFFFTALTIRRCRLPRPGARTQFP